MKTEEIVEWLKVSLLPLTLVTPDNTIEQVIQNGLRFFNTNSAVKMVEMMPITGTTTSLVSQHMKTVAQVYPAQQVSSLNMQDFPLYTLLGINVISGLTSDLILLSETYKNYLAYMGKDFHWNYVPFDAPGTTTSGPRASFAESLAGTGTTWSPLTLQRSVVAGSLVVTSGVEVLTDDGAGSLISNLSGTPASVIDYATGAVSLNFGSASLTARATYQYPTGGTLFFENLPQGCSSLCVVGCRRINYEDDITNEFILDWLLRWCRANVLIIEGNTLRKSDIIGIKNDGQNLMDEAKNDIENLKKELAANGRWLCFGQRI